jgi:outer membrane usher protein
MRSRCSNRALLLLSLFCVCVGVKADDYGLLLLEISFNGQPAQTAFALREADDTFSIEKNVIDTWPVDATTSQVKSHHGVEFMPLSTFEGTTVDFDPATLHLNIQIPPRHLDSQLRILREDQSPNPVAGWGSFVDYNLSYLDESATDSEIFSIFTDASFFSPLGVLTSGQAFVNDKQADQEALADDGFVRLETTFVRDDPSRIRSYRMGDSAMYTGLLRPTLRFGGVQIATNFATRPNFVTFPLPALSGETPMPSDLDLYVNDQLTFHDSLSSGPFELEQIPVVTGAGEVRAVTRDVLGREQVVVGQFYASQRILRPGLSEYSYSAGALREDYGFRSNEYGDGFISGLHRYGLNDTFTIEGSGEASSDLMRMGGGLSWMLPRLGVSTIAVSYSDDEQAGGGSSWLLGHDYQSRKYRYNFSYSGSSEAYRQLGMTEDNRLPQQQLTVGGGLNLSPWGSLGVALVSQDFHDREDRDFASVSYNNSYRNGLSMSFYTSYLHSSDGGSDVSGGITFTMALGSRRSASLSLTNDGEDTRLMTQTRYDLPVGSGFGYRLGADTGSGNDRWEADVAAQSRTGKYSLDSIHDSDGASWQANVSGSAAWIGGKPFLAREIRDSFAVVKVNGFEGVDVFLENQPIGSTDSSGRVLIPGLRPYEANRVTIDIEDLPITARIDASEIQVAPYFRAGAIVNFPADDSLDVRLRLLLPDGSPAPEGAVVRIGDRHDVFPVGINGAVYMIGVEDSSKATLSWGDNSCGLAIDIPETDSPVPNLGDIQCRYVTQ